MCGYGTYPEYTGRHYILEIQNLHVSAIRNQHIVLGDRKIVLLHSSHKNERRSIPKTHLVMQNVTLP